MKDLDDKNLDDFFRRKTLAEGGEPAFDEHAWELMEGKLKKKDWLVFYRNTSVILLLLLIGASAYFSFEVTHKVKKNEYSKNQIIKKDTILNDKETLSQDLAKLPPKQKKLIVIGQNKIAKLIRNRNESVNKLNLKKKDYTTPNYLPNQTIANTEKISTQPINNAQNVLLNANLQIPLYNLAKVETITTLEKGLAEEEKQISIYPALVFTPKKKPVKPANTKIKTGSGIKFSLSFTAGPENNTVNALGSGKTTLATGLLFNTHFKNHLTLSTGMVYGLKNYNANAQQYTFKNTPKYTINNIDATCKVLEIPLKVSYQLLDSKKGAFNVNLGLSSFLMLKEQYTYQYDLQTQIADRVITKTNANQHYLSVLEISSIYQFKSKKLQGIGISPYLKLPLSGIGEGKIYLKSTGFNLTYNYDFVKNKK